MSKVLRYADALALAQGGARLVTALALEAASLRGRVSIALSGGSTPGLLFAQLAVAPLIDLLPWSALHLFWVDERCVPPDGAESNFRLAHEMLIAHVPLPEANVHRMLGELPPGEAAGRYQAELGAFFGSAMPLFDLVLLGVGQDGHTASLFAGAPALDIDDRPVAQVAGSYQGRPARRITLTLPAINNARQVLFVVSGAAKASIVARVLSHAGSDLPAGRIKPYQGDVRWLLDEAAASLLGA